MTGSHEFAAEGLVRELFAASKAAGGQRAVCPIGRRDSLAGVLTRCVVRQSFLTAYQEALVHEQRNAGIRLVMLSGVPEEEILRNGFHGLDEDTLAAMAIDPASVELVVDLVNRTGPWVDDDPDAVGPWVEDAYLREYGLAPQEAVALKPTALPNRSERQRKAPWWLAVAAGLFLGGVGAGLLVHSVLTAEGNQVVQAKASFQPAATKGDKVLMEVKIEPLGKRGFVTLILLRKGRSTWVYPDHGEADIRLEPDKPRVAGPIEVAPGDKLIIVATETPATEVVRRLAKDYDAGSAQQLEEKLRETLQEFGYRWVATSTESVPATGVAP